MLFSYVQGIYQSITSLQTGVMRRIVHARVSGALQYPMTEISFSFQLVETVFRCHQRQHTGAFLYMSDPKRFWDVTHVVLLQ